MANPAHTRDLSAGGDLPALLERLGDADESGSSHALVVAQRLKRAGEATAADAPRAFLEY